MILSASDIYGLLNRDPILGALATVRIVESRPTLDGGDGVYIYIKRYPLAVDFEATWNIWIIDHDENPLDVVIAQIRKLLPRFEIIEQNQIIRATTTELLTDKTEVEPLRLAPELRPATVQDIDSRFDELSQSIEDRMLLVGPGRPGKDGRDGIDGRDGDDGLDGKDLDATEAELGDLSDVFVSDAKKRQFLMFDGSSWIPSFVPQIIKGAVGGGAGVAGSSDVGVIYLKNNSVPTPITTVNGRAIVAGSMLTGQLLNFTKDIDTNSLKYNGAGGLFHIIASFNFFSGSQNICGFYVGRNTNESTALDADADRISETEVYVNAASNSAQPVGGTIQAVLQLNKNDRVFFIVQNKDAVHSITVEFLKFTVTPLAAEKGATGATGPQGATGAAGTIGVDGATGATGIQGPTGATGVTGAIGVSGATGAEGGVGSTGPQGDSGDIGATGPQGDAFDLDYQGTYNSATSYLVSQSVSYSGSVWLSTRATLNETPGSNDAWVTIAAQGAQGPTGPQGVQGFDGATGPQGVGEIGATGATGPAGNTGSTGPAGIDGEDGSQGPPGPNITFQGSVSTFSSLPGGASVSDAYTVVDEGYSIYIWNGSTWVDGGPLQGPAGATGVAGVAGPGGGAGATGATGVAGTQGNVGPAGGGVLSARLSNAINASVTSLVIAATAEWPLIPSNVSSYKILIDNELMTVTATSGTFSSLTLTVTRAQLGTVAASHNKNAIVNLRQILPLPGATGATGVGVTGATGVAGATGPAGGGGGDDGSSVIFAMIF